MWNAMDIKIARQVIQVQELFLGSEIELLKPPEAVLKDRVRYIFLGQVCPRRPGQVILQPRADAQSHLVAIPNLMREDVRIPVV